MRIVPGTPGEVNCPALDEVAKCAVVADLLGDGVVWFAIVPLATSQTVALPAIVSLDDGFATLTNGWQLPYAQDSRTAMRPRLRVVHRVPRGAR